MHPTGRQDALDWLNDHAGKMIRISAQDHSVTLLGRPRKVEELDACSTIIHQCDLASGIAGLHIAISLHDDTLAVHLSGKGEREDPILNASLSLPYAQVEMSIVAEAAVTSPTTPKPAQDAPEGSEPEFSPYELLHTRTD